MIRDFIRDSTKEFTGLLKQFKKPLKVLVITMGCIVGIEAVCIIGWNTVKFHRLHTMLQDVYFMEYGNGETTIHKYDVDQGETVTVAVLNGRYYACEINRSEDYIIGNFHSYENDTHVLLRYNLSDGTMEEVAPEEEIGEKEEWELPEEIMLKMKPTCICWSEHGEKAAFFEGMDNPKTYLYSADSEKVERILIPRWNHFMSDRFGWDISSNYLFYQDNFAWLFSKDANIMIYDIQTGMKTKIYELKNTTNLFEFVRDMD